MSAAATRFTNPSTGTTYRLILGNGDWRVTKSRDDGGQLRLAHLRGSVGTGPLDAAAVARLVAGAGGRAVVATEPTAVFAAIVLHDLERAADVVVAIAREAEEVYRSGCRGFRPRSAALRQQRDTALQRATETCRSMAEAWRAHGLVAPHAIPAWLVAALADN